MSNTLKIVERIRERTGTGTDYAVAKALDMNPSNFRRVMAGTGWLGEKAQRRAAALLGIPFPDINALVNEDKAKSEPERAYWRSLCAEGVRAIINASTTIAATIIAAAALNFFSVVPSTASAAELSQTIDYAPFARRFRRWLGRLFAVSSGASPAPFPA